MDLAIPYLSSKNVAVFFFATLFFFDAIQLFQAISWAESSGQGATCVTTDAGYTSYPQRVEHSPFAPPADHAGGGGGWVATMVATPGVAGPKFLHQEIDQVLLWIPHEMTLEVG